MEGIKTHPDVGLGAMLALLHAHKKFATTDREATEELDRKVKEIRKKADEKVKQQLLLFCIIYHSYIIHISYIIELFKALYYAGYFLYAVNKPEKSKEYIDRSIKQNDSLCEVTKKIKIKQMT